MAYLIPNGDAEWIRVRNENAGYVVVILKGIKISKNHKLNLIDYVIFERFRPLDIENKEWALVFFSFWVSGMSTSQVTCQAAGNQISVHFAEEFGLMQWYENLQVSTGEKFDFLSQRLFNGFSFHGAS